MRWGCDMNPNPLTIEVEQSGVITLYNEEQIQRWLGDLTLFPIARPVRYRGFVIIRYKREDDKTWTYC